MTKALPAKKTRTARTPAQSPEASPVTKPVTPSARKARAAAPAVNKPASPAKKPAPEAQAVVAKHKPKLVRDSFTIPKSEYVVLEALKLRAATLGRPTKKSEVLRAGIAALQAMSDRALLAAIHAIPTLKTGRPKNVSKAAAS